MVKFGKNKFKALNKIAKGQKIAAETGVSNKTIKKKINLEKKVTFQKEVLLKNAVLSGSNTLVKNVTANKITHESSKDKKKIVKEPENKNLHKPKKSVEKRKKRQKMQIDDTKLMLRLMKKSK